MRILSALNWDGRLAVLACAPTLLLEPYPLLYPPAGLAKPDTSKGRGKTKYNPRDNQVKSFDEIANANGQCSRKDYDRFGHAYMMKM